MESLVNTEELYQKVHDLERALNISESMRGNMQQDIESLQAQLNSNEANFQDYKKRIEMELSNKWMDKLRILRSELDDEREASSQVISELKKRINQLEHQELTVPENDVNENLKDLLNKIQDQNSILKEQIDELNLVVENNEEEKKQLNVKIKSLGERYEEVSHILDSKKEALLQATEALKDIQEEKALLSNELASLKAGPIDEERRGNSLFAEVEDNRQLLMKNISTLKSKLVEAKIILSSKSSELIKLKNDNDRLHHKIKELDRVVKPEQIKLIEAYKTRINELELLVNKLQKQESQKIIPMSESNRLQWVYNSLEKTRSELREFQQQFNKVSQQRLSDLEELSAHQQEIRILKAELSTLKLNYESKVQEFEEKTDSDKSDNHVENLDPNVINGDVKECSNKTTKGVRFAEI